MHMKRLSLRTLPLLLIVLLLAGCYRQAGDSFESVDGQGAQQQIIPTATTDTSALTPTVMIIDPATDTTPVDDAMQALELTATAIAGGDDASEPTPLLPPTDAAPATATVIVIQLDSPTNTPAILSTPMNTPIPSPQAQGMPTLLPTATQPRFITPESVEQLPIEQATPTATLSAADAGTAGNGIITPTAIPTELPSECIYIVQSGDNLFRIAFNNGIALADLLAVNNLSENSIIQPNQELRLPGCLPDLSDDALTVPDSVLTDAPPTALPAGTALYVVASGDTLLVIARRYGVTVAEIVEANGLSDADTLSVGQELIIPNQ